jgi:deoxyribonuclease V
MEIRPIHAWPVDCGEARKLQNKLSESVILTSQELYPKTIAGIDVSVTRFSKMGRSAIVVLSWPNLEIVDLSTVEGEIAFPYVPGFLSFREAPLVIRAWEQLDTRPDLIMVDGQGIAHPRRLGIASHLGLLFDAVSIGCAKSRLVGEYGEPPDEPGSHSLLSDRNEVVGAVVRTRRSVKPVFVSPGHKIALRDSISWVLNCCRGLRLPEPTRLAHLAAGGQLGRPASVARRTT